MYKLFGCTTLEIDDGIPTRIRLLCANTTMQWKRGKTEMYYQSNEIIIR